MHGLGSIICRLAVLILVVRLVDPLIGAAVGLRVESDLEDGTAAAGVYAHTKLYDSVG